MLPSREASPSISEARLATRWTREILQMYRTETVVIRYITLRFILSGIFAVVVRIPHPLQSFADRVKEVIRRAE